MAWCDSPLTALGICTRNASILFRRTGLSAKLKERGGGQALSCSHTKAARRLAAAMRKRRRFLSPPCLGVPIARGVRRVGGNVQEQLVAVVAVAVAVCCYAVPLSSNRIESPKDQVRDLRRYVANVGFQALPATRSWRRKGRRLWGRRRRSHGGRSSKVILMCTSTVLCQRALCLHRQLSGSRNVPRSSAMFAQSLAPTMRRRMKKIVHFYTSLESRKSWD